MSTQNLLKMIDELVEKKTFSLDAIEAVKKMRDEAKQLADQVVKLEADGQLKEAKLQSYSAEIIKLRSNESDVTQREGAVAKRELTVVELDKKTAVAEAVTVAVKECFGLVFRNLELRSTMFGQAPGPTSANPSYFPVTTVAVNKEENTTIK